MYIQVGKEYVTKGGEFVTVIEKQKTKDGKPVYIVEMITRYFVNQDGQVSEKIYSLNDLECESEFNDDDLLKESEFLK